MNHTPFIAISYAVFALFLLIDGLAPWLARRTLVRELGQRLKREQKRQQQPAPDADITDRL
ncbi:heme exporter protein CcmD [Ahniella affigens]|uniref:Heme exporter protein D n=1 Tax=Ahniella affigens TaxID=2021234 RepID=A0A2P1PQF5_9GAMM|nr:heme exporter protein CcmD [Ahniella affigens]AVP97075.1 heme exporter protein CcmD [Ahniella affigens]